jgi:hypothetical protein
VGSLEAWRLHTAQGATFISPVGLPPHSRLLGCLGVPAALRAEGPTSKVPQSHSVAGDRASRRHFSRIALAVCVGPLNAGVPASIGPVHAPPVCIKNPWRYPCRLGAGGRGRQLRKRRPAFALQAGPRSSAGGRSHEARIRKALRVGVLERGVRRRVLEPLQGFSAMAVTSRWSLLEDFDIST